jgi:hypothetical protein
MGDKIHDVSAYWLLASSRHAGVADKPMGAEMLLQATLGVGQIAAKLTCEVTGHHAPSP